MPEIVSFDGAGFKSVSISQINDATLQVTADFFELELLESEFVEKPGVAGLFGNLGLAADFHNAVGNGHISERKNAVLRLVEHFVDYVIFFAARFTR